MATVPSEAVLSVLQQLSHDIRDLDVGLTVDRHQRLPVVQFLRDYVAANKPVVLTNVACHWPAYKQWSDEYLCSVAGDTEVTVSLTPNGLAEAVAPMPADGASSKEDEVAGQPPGERLCFAQPHQQRMPLSQFLELLRSSRQQGESAAAPAGDAIMAGSGISGARCDSAGELPQDGKAAVGAAAAPTGAKAANSPACTTTTAGAGAGGSESSTAARQHTVVPYLQFQNSSLTAELPQLLGDVDLLLSWATQAFGGLPEAVNLWFGDERSVTSWHHDPYENVYAVVAGSKTFTLMPPAEVYRMRLHQYCKATYEPVRGGAGSCPAAELEGVTSGTVALHPMLAEPAQRVLCSSLAPNSTGLPMAGADASKAGAAGLAPGELAPGERDLFAEPSLPPPLKVTVRAGEALYLPAMWWHLVEQEPDDSGRAIAVNYWYDMKVDARLAYYQAVERLAELLGLNDKAPPPPPASSVRSVRSVGY